MPTFPLLKTGAVAQYPAVREQHFATDIVRFVDGAEQRFRDYKSASHRWVITLSLLDETEVQSIRAFVSELQGAAGVFSFTDPWDQSVYERCSLEGDAAMDALTGPSDGGTQITIRENWT
jgi:hypothetical protein